ncbi:MAG: cyanophycin synthetase [Xanthomonadales bacterium]|nr:cyanophycin synthetase [Gammaproteobacteria bacterium]MBT8053543.1 cyanophycin synthetase [Gammaproteobacteria bacterium]NND57976.1 cyanophycin synthetase [Xanthomonadales bacterium]NNK50858.1 cyanophycin synthetase [Xanthomonadales bacterium]
MKILATNVYLGPSLYAHFPVIRHQVDIGVLEDWPSVRLGDAFIDSMVEALPGLSKHGCSYGEPGGFLRRLSENEGTWMAHIWEHAAIELQNMAGSDVSFGKTRGIGPAGHYNMVFQYKQREVGLEAARISRQLLLNLLPEALRKEFADQLEEGFDFEEERDNFIRFAQRKELGPSTASLVKAAEEREIPSLRLNKYSLVQFGHGRYQQRIQATITSKTPHIAVEISCDKEDTHNLLRDLGLPVPQQRMISSEREAVRAASRIGYPVVVKPLDANHGRGVSINLLEDDQVRAAFGVALESARGRNVLVESFIEGMDHRMLVVNDELVAVAKRVPGHVQGDGKQTISELVDKVNEDPRRGIGHEKVLTRLEIDHQAERLMEKAGINRDTVLPGGEVFFLRSTANLSTGGTAIDMTDLVHPDNREMAVRAIQAVGLDVGGVDFLTADITKSYKEVGGAIVEVNAAPGFRMHVAPSEGKPRDVAGKVMDMLFPPGSPCRVPVVSITGTNGKTTTSRMLAHILKTAGHTVGLTSTDGVYIDGRLSVKGDMTGPASAHIVLRDPTIDMAVLETARGGLLRAGLGYRRCDVSACLNVASDHLGINGIDTLEQLAELKRIPIEVARNAAVLNADDERCLHMADYTQAEHVCYITMNPAHTLVKEHIRAGGRAVVLEQGIAGDMITLYDNGTHFQLLWTHLIPATMDGKATHNVQNAMFAAAMAFSIGKSLEDIRHGLQTFNSTIFQAPGRMNVFDEHPFRVILDYGHNAAAIASISQLVSRLEVTGRRICVLAAPGDRRDEDIRAIADAAAGAYDHYLCKADDNRRGRGHDEVPVLLREQLLKSGVAKQHASVVPAETEAVQAALEMAGKGDLVVIFGDNIERCWNQVAGHQAKAGDADSDTPQITAQSFVEEDPEAFTLDPGSELIRDERGVRIARVEEESD